MERQAPDIAVFVINLERSQKRRDEMVSRLEKIGLNYTLFPACDGKALWDQIEGSVNVPAFERNTGRTVIKAEIGTYHSHLNVWKAFLETGKGIALILEDDVVFHDDFVDAITVAAAQSAKWDFLKLNRIRAKIPVSRGKIGTYDLNGYIGPATGLGAYMITRQCAKNLLTRMLPISRPIDHELDRTFAHKFRHYGLEPFPSHVDDGNESTITGSSFSEVRKFPKWKRLPNYFQRFRNLIGKRIYLMNKNH